MLKENAARAPRGAAFLGDVFTHVLVEERR